MRPSKSVPGGCVIGLVGVGSFLYGALSLVAAWMIWKKQIGVENLNFLIVSGLAAVLLAVALIVVGIKLAMKVPRDYDPNDPAEPRMKF